jgi:hypothetical protein
VPSLDIPPSEHASACVAARGKPPSSAQPRAQITPNSDEERWITGVSAHRQPARAGIGRGEIIADVRMAGHDRERFAWTALARSMAIDEPFPAHSSLALPEAAQAQHPDLSSKRTSASMNRAGSDSAPHAKLAEFTRNRPEGSTWID